MKKSQQLKKILYVMNVDWNWIKQRPHFIAEGLSRYYDTKIIYQYKYGRKGYQKRKEKNNIVNYKVIPRFDRYRITSWLNNIIRKIIFKKEINKYNPNFVYLTHPNQYVFVPKNYCGKIIYDCMDNHIDLSNSSKYYRAKIFNNELNILKRADIVITSSRYLEKILKKRYDFKKHISIIYNAYNGKPFNEREYVSNNNKIIITYFGTIATWFDFNILLKSVNDFDNIEYHLYGPINDCVIIPKNKHIKYFGTIEHNKIFNVTKNTNIFILPFKISEAIKSVDPVKLYEYINFNKNIISIKYDEINRFSKFVYFYKNYSQFKSIIKKLMKNNALKYKNSERIKFLQSNTWENRVKSIVRLLEN